jgi:CheY-like chemotaxis protein
VIVFAETVASALVSKDRGGLMVRILVAEDNELSRMWLCDELTSDGHVVIETGNGDEAAGFLCGGAEIDLVMTDICMPGTIDGWQLGEKAKQFSRSIRIMYVTSYSVEMRRMESNERMLHKPFLYRDVRRIIAELGL